MKGTSCGGSLRDAFELTSPSGSSRRPSGGGSPSTSASLVGFAK
jgi:hypothetical protein